LKLLSILIRSVRLVLLLEFLIHESTDINLNYRNLLQSGTLKFASVKQAFTAALFASHYLSWGHIVMFPNQYNHALGPLYIKWHGNNTEIPINEGVSRFVLAKLMLEFPLIELTMLAVYVNLWCSPSVTQILDSQIGTSLHASSHWYTLAAILLSRSWYQNVSLVSIGHALPVLCKFVRDGLYPSSTLVDWTAAASLHALYCELVCKVKAWDALRG